MEFAILGSKVIQRSYSQTLVLGSVFQGDHNGDHDSAGQRVIQRSITTWVMESVLPVDHGGKHLRVSGHPDVIFTNFGGGNSFHGDDDTSFNFGIQSHLDMFEVQF